MLGLPSVCLPPMENPPNAMPISEVQRPADERPHDEGTENCENVTV